MTVLDESTTASTGSWTARLRLTPTNRRSGPLDGAWWPCSRDLVRELPALTAALDPLWGRITSVTVNPAYWPVIPRKVPVNGHVVRVGAFGAEQDPHELFLASYTVGRWDLLIVPPETAPDRAAALMLAAADPHNSLTASGLLKTVGPPAVACSRRMAGTRNVAPGAAEWESEGGAVRTAPAPTR
ncbi:MULTISPECIES: DUF5994 family protein [Streptomyces]|uniref:Uncharacterized protein n=1 Tax=Streptomyces rimosus subsp. rimosus TaxID=132474 RepID=A0ABY3YSU7_STRRM|nr:MULTISPECIES: DUF5994 family protein [Streptomyces]KOG52445.1 hypothetical protein ADK76_32070 [Streptomyces griseoflavus]KOG75007.1 hypothetical protein ADK78_13670 [Kitasatospora aureofaciens]KOT41803.1 hypothetical protein ADK84_10695 [Streptomyces sp. NRRL WC-3701]KOT43960.1 hypothetical protein ADK42_06485 [Streptomyces rimosus subsp. rimosus]KOT67297.1 hypothetical protein ADK44_03865 [Streptomyces rimosus subsp. rimosus]